MPSAARDIRDALTVCLASEAGPEYNELKYLDSENLSKNSFTRMNTFYGVRPGVTPENNPTEVTRSLDYLQTFEFVLTKGYCQDGVSDSEKYEAFLDLHEIALSFQRKVINTKAGLPSRVLNAINLNIDAPLFLDDKVTVLTGSIDILYRLNL
jgi:hypothetical protein